MNLALATTARPPAPVLNWVDDVDGLASKPFMTVSTSSQTRHFLVWATDGKPSTSTYLPNRSNDKAHGPFALVQGDASEGIRIARELIAAGDAQSFAVGQASDGATFLARLGVRGHLYGVVAPGTTKGQTNENPVFPWPLTGWHLHRTKTEWSGIDPHLVAVVHSANQAVEAIRPKH